MVLSSSLGVYVFLFIALYFEVFLLIAFLESRPRKQTTNLPAKYPEVCIIVPVWNEEKTIEGTLRSLLNLTYPKDALSIMVVDDGSKDNTAFITKRIAEENPSITYHYKENGGKYTALNYGITHTNAEFVGCLDADSFVASDGLVEMIKKFETDSEVYALTPAMVVYQPKNAIEWMQAVEYTIGVFYKKMFDTLSAITVVPGPFSIYRRSVFDKIGLFKEAHNTEDMEIAFRMHANGLKIGNVHTARIYTTVPKNIPALIKQRTRWSQGYLQNSIDYRYMYFNPRFGNFGILVLPFGLTAFASGLYTAAYSVYHLLSSLGQRIFDQLHTGIPPQLQLPHFEWFYLNTSMMNFLVFTVLAMTVTAVFLGQRMAQNKITPQSILFAFTLLGLIAPIWLVRAAWGTIRGGKSRWR